jgi:hypothetical protein
MTSSGLSPVGGVSADLKSPPSPSRSWLGAGEGMPNGKTRQVFSFVVGTESTALQRRAVLSRGSAHCGSQGLVGVCTVPSPDPDPHRCPWDRFALSPARPTSKGTGLSLVCEARCHVFDDANIPRQA